MQPHTGKRALEKYRVFPYVAWAVTVGFAVFVYMIVVELQAATDALETTSTALQQQVNQFDPQADFDGFQNTRPGVEAQP